MDARTAISAAKHFIHTPMPLFQYLCTLEISRAHEHVFLLHWCEGQIRGDWKSQIPISCVASKLALSESTVKRAYRELAELGLIRRYSQGRCRYNPMRSDVTVTEVTIPDAVAKELMSARNRAAAAEASPAQAEVPKHRKQCAAPAKRKPAYQALHDDSEVETEFGAPASDDSRRTARANNSTKRSACQPRATRQEARPQEPVTEQLDRPQAAPGAAQGAEGGRIASWFAIKLRRALRQRLDESKVNEPWHQMLWSIGYGSLSEQPLPKAFNVAMKLLRQNRWMTPWDMPDGWEWAGA
jgi:DNA-binding Lrp family transcriptional regulator